MLLKLYALAHKPQPTSKALLRFTQKAITWLQQLTAPQHFQLGSCKAKANRERWSTCHWKDDIHFAETTASFLTRRI